MGTVFSLCTSRVGIVAHASNYTVIRVTKIIKYAGKFGRTLELYTYRGADKSLARPGRKQATATEDFDFHISYL